MTTCLLNLIPPQLLAHDIISRIKDYEVTDSLFLIVSDAKQDKIYWKRCCEYKFERTLGSDDLKSENSYDVDWEYVHKCCYEYEYGYSLLTPNIDNPAYIDLAIDLDMNPSEYNNLPISYAARWNHIKIIDRLLQDKRVDPTVRPNRQFNYNPAILEAMYKGNVEATMRLSVAWNQHVDPS